MSELPSSALENRLREFYSLGYIRGFAEAIYDGCVARNLTVDERERIFRKEWHEFLQGMYDESVEKIKRGQYNFGEKNYGTA